MPQSPSLCLDTCPEFQDVPPLKDTPYPLSCHSPLPSPSSHQRDPNVPCAMFSPRSYLGDHEPIGVLSQQTVCLFLGGTHVCPYATLALSAPGCPSCRECGPVSKLWGGQPLGAAARAPCWRPSISQARITLENPISPIKEMTKLKGARWLTAHSFCPCCAHSPETACLSHLPPYTISYGTHPKPICLPANHQHG